jgi:prepilin signal peptidase PulO-like enzyme (type II secretory pathway)
MVSAVGLILLLAVLLRICLVDLKNHYIHNFDLLLLFFIQLIFFDLNLYYGFSNLAIYTGIYLLSQKRLGFGDVKLAFILGLGFNSIFNLIYAANFAWIMAGIWGLLSRRQRIAFAPWLISGASLAKILVI